ncbi:polysaccharide biosynthesis C-terminal domain-containing protein [Zhouia sp. PK063]|uniref:oligosaccharide flippase family protein n=1 Tax=Zhouia sp. PK063 TaxID=3373602 RepID=UPI00378D178C
MGAFKKLFQHTFIYGVATILPRILSFFLTPLYISQLKSEADYGSYTLMFSFMILGNVVLSYGMETAFFRFINKSERKAAVQSTALTSLLISSVLFFAVTFFFREQIANWAELKLSYVSFAIGILTLDALAVIPFTWYRNQSMPIKYSFVKLMNIIINFGLNIFFFLALPKLITGEHPAYLQNLIFKDSVNYIFLANIIASVATLIMVMPLYFRIGLRIDGVILKKMLAYGLPILVAGIAYSINETFDKIILNYLLPENSAKSVVGIYGACYKLGVFMTLFITAFKLGVEPFFFNHAHKKNAKETYANITLYFTIFGTFILLFVITYIDVLKHILIPKQEYWEAITIVPYILLANLCLGIYHNLSVWYKVTDKTNYGAIISVLGAVVTLSLNFTLIPLIGYKASAIATLAAYSFMMFISFFIGQRKYPIPYNLKKIGAYLGTSITFSIISFYVFDRNIIVGTVLLLVFLALIYTLEKKDLQKIFIKK